MSGPTHVRASSMQPKRSGRSGRYLSVLKWASENGLSSETCGRLWVLLIPRSAMSSAVDFAIIGAPRSEWMVSCPGLTHCFVDVSETVSYTHLTLPTSDLV